MSKDSVKSNKKVAGLVAGGIVIGVASAIALSVGAQQTPVAPSVDVKVAAPAVAGRPSAPAQTTSVTVQAEAPAVAPAVDPATPAQTTVQVTTAADPSVPVVAPANPLVDNVAITNLRTTLNQQDAAFANGTIARGAESLVTPYVVPPQAPGIYQGSDKTFREMSFLSAEESVINARTTREAALAKQVETHIKLKELVDGTDPAKVAAAEEDAKKLAGSRLGSDGKPLPAGSTGSTVQGPFGALPGDLPAPASISALSHPAVAVVKTPKPPKPKPPVPFVGSVYSFGGESYAEIYLAGNKVIAKPGTVLMNGDKVESVSIDGVVIRGKSGKKTLPVVGLAGVSQQ